MMTMIMMMIIIIIKGAASSKRLPSLNSKNTDKWLTKLIS